MREEDNERTFLISFYHGMKGVSTQNDTCYSKLQDMEWHDCSMPVSKTLDDNKNAQTLYKLWDIQKELTTQYSLHTGVSGNTYPALWHTSTTSSHEWSPCDKVFRKE